MSQELYTTQDLPLDGASKKFAGIRALDEASNPRFVAQEGVNVTTVAGNRVGNAKVQVGAELGAGATIGTTGDAAVITDAAGSLSAKLRGLIVLTLDLLGRIGAGNETAPASDTAASGLNGRLQRIAQHLTTVAANTLASAKEETLLDVNGRIGAGTETVPATDTAAAGLNGRLQRIAQHLTSVLAVLPASRGQKAMADSLPVVVASGQTITVSEAPAGVGSYGQAVAVTSNPTAIRAANLTRKRITVKNSEEGTEPVIWLGFDATLTAGKSGKNIGPLYPGESLTLAYTGAIYGITSTSTAYAAFSEMS